MTPQIQHSLGEFWEFILKLWTGNLNNMGLPVSLKYVNMYSKFCTVFEELKKAFGKIRTRLNYL